MKTRSLAPLALALLALTPAAADAAVKTGSYLANPLSSGVDGTSATITVDGGKVTALIFTWSCSGSEEVDRRTVIVSDAGDDAVFPVKGDKLKWSGRALTQSGDIYSDTFDFKEGKATVKVTGKWKGSKVSGTFTAKTGGCSSGPLSYTAKRS